MWSFMESAKSSPFMKSGQEGVFMKNNQEGIETVKAGNGLYAFLMESTTIDYVVERECDTTQIGGLLGKKEQIASTINYESRLTEMDNINDRLEGVWDRSAAGLTVSYAHLVRDLEAAGGGAAARAQEALVEGEEGRRPVRIGK